MDIKDLVIGKKYKTSTNQVYYCGVNEHGNNVFELIDYKAVANVALPKGWISKGNNTYWFLNPSDVFEILEEEQPTNSLKVSDCQLGEFYYCEYAFDKPAIIKCTEINKLGRIGITNNGGDWKYYPNNQFSCTSNLRLATLEEKQWLETCIKANKYIPKEQALKEVEKPQFEVGKWYKSNCGKGFSSTGYYYLKVKKNDYYELIGEAILDCGYKEDHSWDAKDTLKQALELGPLTDLSEIQQYLPSNHPDKIVEKPKELSKEESLVGRYVKYTKLFENKEWYGLKIGYYDTILEDKSYEYILTKFGSIPKDRLFESFELMPIDFNPNNLPESKTEVMEEFKVGDWVYCEKQDNNDFRLKEFIPVFKIQDFNMDTDFLRPVHGSPSGVHRKFCRLAKPEEIPTTSNSFELSSLPEKWFVKIPKYDELDPYCLAIEKFRKPTGFGPKWYNEGYLDYSGIHQGSSKPSTSLTEISEDQFKREILNYSPKQSIDNQLIDKMNDEIPEYWEIIEDLYPNCCNGYKKGTIVKADNKFHNSNTVGFINYNNIPDGFNSSNFKPSTKEAYEAQFKSKVVEEEKWKVGGFVRITNSSSYIGTSYNSGEIWKVGSLSYNRQQITIERGTLTAMVYTGEVGGYRAECEWLGMTNPEESKTTEKWRPKVGDKVNIPRSKQDNLWYKNNTKELDDYNLDYFLIKSVDGGDYNIGLQRADGKRFYSNSFFLTDLSPYSPIDNYSNVQWQDGGTLSKYIVAIDPSKQSKKKPLELEYQSPVIVKQSKNKKSKLVIIN